MTTSIVEAALRANRSSLHDLIAPRMRSDTYILRLSIKSEVQMTEAEQAAFEDLPLSRESSSSAFFSSFEGRALLRNMMISVLGDSNALQQDMAGRLIAELLRLFAGVPAELSGPIGNHVSRALFYHYQSYMDEPAESHRAPQKKGEKEHKPKTFRNFVVESSHSPSSYTTVLHSLLKAASSVESGASIEDFERKLRAAIQVKYGKMRTQHSGAIRAAPFHSLYVPQLLTTRTETTSFHSALRAHQRLVVLGDPGGGKSTLTQAIVLALASGAATTWRSDLVVPFPIVVRDVDVDRSTPTEAIVDHLEGWCREELQVPSQRATLDLLLLTGRAEVIFDGLDELTDGIYRRKFVDRLERFTYLYPDVGVIATSRRVGYALVPLDSTRFAVASLNDFNDAAVLRYATQWFKLDEAIPKRLEERYTKSFMRESRSVQDLRRNPLMLQLMCSIYAAENYIPRNRAEIYEKCAQLLFERWDKHRGVVVRLPFDAHIQAAIFALAKWMYDRSSDGQSTVRRLELLDFMIGYLLRKQFDTEEEAVAAAEAFIDFCTGRAWVLSDVGLDADGNSLYQFTHRTFLEYFTARQLTREHPNAWDLFLYLHESILQGRDDVVAQISLQLLGVHVEDGADDFLSYIIDSFEDEPLDSAEALNLASFAARSLSLVVPRASIVKAIASIVLRRFAESPSRSTDPMYALLCAAPEVLPSIKRELLKQLSTILDESPTSNLLSLAIYPSEFCAKNPEALPVHIDFWLRGTSDIREHLSSGIEKSVMKFPWSRLYLMAQGQLPPAETVHGSHVRFLFRESSPAWIRTVPLATGIACHLGDIGNSADVRSDIKLALEHNSGELAGQLVDMILECPMPWRSGTGELFVIDPQRFWRTKLPADIRVASLYALLAAFHTDVALALKDETAITLGRREYWARMTNGLFTGMQQSMFVTGDVNGFFYRWFGGGWRTVRSDAVTEEEDAIPE